MKDNNKYLLKAMAAPGIFILTQVIGGIVAATLARLVSGKSASTDTGWVQPVAGLIAGVLCCMLLMSCGIVRGKHSWTKWQSSGRWVVVASVATMACIVAGDLLTEMLDVSNDALDKRILAIATHPLGMVVIAIIAPVVEELAFREGLQRWLHRIVEPWTAILLSGVVFGIIHMNMEQGIFATLMGVVFSMLYYKTGSILLTSIIHILNNGLAVALMLVLGEKAAEFSYSEWLGGTLPTTITIAVCGVIGVLGLKAFWQKA